MLHPKLIELENQFNPSPLTQLFDPLLAQKQLELWIKRDDLIDSVISGNKWRKLKYILDHALKMKAHTVISMGGAYSNHLHALAFVGRHLKLKTVGYIRGERPKHFSPTLQDLESWGMELRFVSRTDYRELRQFKHCDDLPLIEKGQYWLPEGGATELALQGVAELVSEIDWGFDVLCVPCGTGTTLAGLIPAVPNNCNVHGFAALKGASFLMAEVEALLSNKAYANWSIQLDYHFGGFAKTNNELLLFMDAFNQQHAVELDPVYTGKMFYGLFDLITQDYFKPQQKIVAIHTGGLQGTRSM